MGQPRFTNITTATTTNVETQPCVLDRIVINTAAAGTIAIHNDANGTNDTIGTIEASAAAGDYEYGCWCTDGLTVVTGAATDITVVTRQKAGLA